MPKKKTSPVRLNIYVHDPGIRRQIKAVAAQKDISVSEYCLRAITEHLSKEQVMTREEGGSRLKTAAEKACRFQTETFRGRSFAVSSADLIREAREDRNTF